MKRFSTLLIALLVSQGVTQTAIAEVSLNESNIDFDTLVKMVELQVASSRKYQSDRDKYGANWTPYLAPLLEGCDVASIPKKLPNKYTNLVYDTRDIYTDDRIGHEYLLSGATLFGYELSKVVYLQSSKHMNMMITFRSEAITNEDFMSLRNMFTLPYLSDDDLIFNNNETGYTTYDNQFTLLKFDDSKKMITCAQSF